MSCIFPSYEYFTSLIHISLMQMILGQSSSSDFSLLWESELEYHACRNNWKEVSRLLDLIPASVLSAGSLQLNLDALHPTSTLGFNMKPSNYGNFLCSLEELDSVCMEVSDVQIYKFSPNMCSVWLRMFMQEKLAKRFIFLKEYWEGTMEIVSLLARSGFISGRDERRTLEDDCLETSSDKGGTLQALHKVIVHHCAQYNLPNLLDLYLDRHGLVLDNDSLCSIQESAVSSCSLKLIVLHLTCSDCDNLYLVFTFQVTLLLDSKSSGFFFFACLGGGAHFVL